MWLSSKCSLFCSILHDIKKERNTNTKKHGHSSAALHQRANTIITNPLALGGKQPRAKIRVKAKEFICSALLLMATAMSFIINEAGKEIESTSKNRAKKKLTEILKRKKINDEIPYSLKTEYCMCLMVLLSANSIQCCLISRIHFWNEQMICLLQFGTVADKVYAEILNRVRKQWSGLSCQNIRRHSLPFPSLRSRCCIMAILPSSSHWHYPASFLSRYRSNCGLFCFDKEYMLIFMKSMYQF